MPNNDTDTDTASSSEAAESAPRSGKLVVAACVTIVVLIVGFIATGMPGMNHGSGSAMPGMQMGQPAQPYKIVGAGGFAALIADPVSTLINVHVPYDGEIEGTKLFLPFDSLDPSKLPTNKSALLLVYCRSGNMSAVASAKLAALGYTNVVELAGGMDAWQASNRSLVRDPTRSNSSTT